VVVRLPRRGMRTLWTRVYPTLEDTSGTPQNTLNLTSALCSLPTSAHWYSAPPAISANPSVLVLATTFEVRNSHSVLFSCTVKI